MDIVQQQLLELGQKVEATNQAIARLDQALSLLLEEMHHPHGGNPWQGSGPMGQTAADRPATRTPSPMSTPPPSTPEHLLWQSSSAASVEAVSSVEQSSPSDRSPVADSAPIDPDSDAWPELRPDLRTDLHPELRPGARTSTPATPRSAPQPPATPNNSKIRSKTWTKPRAESPTESAPRSVSPLARELRPESRPDLHHKDILEDDGHYSDSDFSMQDRPLALDMQVQRLTAQLTAAYNRIAALEEQLLSQRMHASREHT